MQCYTAQAPPADSGRAPCKPCAWSCYTKITRWNAPVIQHCLYPAVVFLQHTLGPLGGGQLMTAHPVGQPKVAAPLALSFFLWAFLGAFLPGLASGAVACAACPELAEADGLAADGVPAVSPAQAGATIKTNKSSSIFFMFPLPLWLKNIYGLPSAGGRWNAPCFP